MVHFYDEISRQELFEICRHELSDIEEILEEVLAWVEANPDRVTRDPAQ